MKKIISLLLILVLCSAIVIAKTENKITHKIAVAISGAVITSDDGKKITYLDKCENCHHIGTVRHTRTLNVGGSISSSYYCPKCKTRNQVRIERSR